MNILFVVPDFYPNSTGFANASINLINTIIKYGSKHYKLTVFTTVPLGNNNELEGVRVVRYASSTFDNRFTHVWNERRKYINIKKYIEDNNIDIIFFETNTFPFVQYWALKDFGNKVFVRIHSTADTEVPVYGIHKALLDKLECHIVRKFMRSVNNIISTSNYYLDFIKEKFLDGNVYSVWGNKTYNLLFNTSGEVIKPSTAVFANVFMTMGKMSDNGITQKGITDLLKAVYYIYSTGGLPNDFKLIVVGTGIKYPVVKKYVQELGLENYVELIESATHDKVFELISNSKAIVLLSRYEGQSMFITESISLGKPLLITGNNGMQDMIRDQYNGYLVKTGDAHDAAKALQRYLSLDFETIKKMGNNSSTIYEDYYSDKAVFQQFDDIMKLRFKGE